MYIDSTRALKLWFQTILFQPHQKHRLNEPQVNDHVLVDCKKDNKFCPGKVFMLGCHESYCVVCHGQMAWIDMNSYRILPIFP
eukprot:UN08478